MIALLALAGFLTYWLPLGVITVGDGRVADRVAAGAHFTVGYVLAGSLAFAVAIEVADRLERRR